MADRQGDHKDPIINTEKQPYLSQRLLNGYEWRKKRNDP